MANSISINLKRWHIEAFTILGVLLTLGGTIDFLDARAQLPNGDVVPAYQAKQTQVVSVQQGMGPIKFACAFVGFSVLAGTYYLSYLAQQQEEEQNRVMIRIQAEEEYNSDVRARFRELEAQAELEAHQQVIAPAVATAHIDRVLASDPRLVDYMEGDHAIEPSAPAQALNPQDALLAAVDKMNAQSPIQSVTQASVAAPTPIAPPAPAVVQAVTRVMPTQPQVTQPVATAPILPDGAEMIEPSAMAKVNQFPVVLVIATPGNGKTETMRYVMSQLNGTKVFCSHKAEKADADIFDLCFGYDPIRDESAYRGDDTTTAMLDDRDLEWFRNNNGGIGTVAEFYWAALREIKNRQKLGPTRAAEKPFYRCFADEASFAYSSLFKDALNPDLIKWGQNLIEASNVATFMDGRSHLVQMFYAAQSESVATIGLKNLSKLRDDTWHMYPGPAAVVRAGACGKSALAGWLKNRMDSGYAIALLEKQKEFFYVLNLPLIEQLNPKVVRAVEPVVATPEHHPTYDLIKQAG